MEQFVIRLGIGAIGFCAGFYCMLLIRVAIHKGKGFSWKGSLGVFTVLAGGGFLSFLSEPINFGFYAIGFFIGFIYYLTYLLIRRKSFSWRDQPLERSPVNSGKKDRW